MPKPKTKKQLIKIADRLFSQYIRLKAATDNGYCTCVTCGRVKRWNEGMHAGHFIVRVWIRVRYDERNVHCQCNYCNTWLGGCTEMYYDYLRGTYGQKVIDELKVTSRIPPNSADRDELEKLIETLKPAVAKLLKEKGL